MELFPLILRPSDRKLECPEFIRLDALNEEWAQKNHGQTLAQLKRRGGLSPCEAVANIERRAWRAMRPENAVDLVRRHAPAPP